MINTNDILQTIQMIDHQHLDVRTITMGVNLLDCPYFAGAGVLFFMVDIFQNGDNKNCKSKQHHKFFVCTHRKRLLPFKARKRRYSHPIGSPGKHIILSWY